MALVPLVQLIQERALNRRAEWGREILDGSAFRPDERPLINRRQKAGTEPRAADAQAAVGHDDVPGQVLALGAQAIKHPRADARMSQEDGAALQQAQRRAVNE